MVRFIEAKTILSTVRQKPDPYFGLYYNMNLYRGCQHGCIYCDSRSICYRLGDLSDIRIKKDALNILEQELKSKRIKNTVGFGSMNDCYMPVEQEFEYTRNALHLMIKYKFPVHIITKSHLVLRDIELLQQLSSKYAAVTITITTYDDDLSKIIEPNAPVSSLRFEAIKKLSEAGIYCGIAFMPVLPFINDSEENIIQLLNKAKENGAKYILPYFGLTLREGQREYFYQQLDKYFPNLKKKYVNRFGNMYNCNSPIANKLYKLLFDSCSLANIATKMSFYHPPKTEQLKLF